MNSLTSQIPARIFPILQIRSQHRSHASFDLTYRQIWLQGFSLLCLVALLVPSSVVAAERDVISSAWITITDIVHRRYDGVTDDLLTAGLGKDGLANPIPPSTRHPPTAEDLRRLAIYNFYRGLIDTLPGFDQRFIPLQFYYQHAFQHLWRHLMLDEPLPPSQVVHTQTRGLSPDGSVPPLNPETHLPPLSESSAPEALIRINGNKLQIPE